MGGYVILDEGKPILKVEAEEGTGKVTSVSAVEGVEDWYVDAGRECQEAGLNIMQVVRFFGRNAGYEEDEMVRKVNRDRSGAAVVEGDEIDIVPGEIIKTDPSKQIVFGWAYVLQDKDGVQVVDKSGDFHDDIEDFEETAYDYVLKSRQSDADHTNVKGGEMVESIVFTPEKIEKMGLPQGVVPLGWWVGYKISDAATWARVEKGELVAFSIGGTGTRTKVAPE